MEVQPQALFTQTLDGHEYTQIHPRQLYIRRKPFRQHRIGGVGHRAGVGTVEKRKILHLQGIEPRYPNRIASNSVSTTNELSSL